MKLGSTVVASYDYLGGSGGGQVVGTDYPEIEVMSNQGTGSGTYPDLDRFSRLVTSKWTKDLSTDKDFYDVDLAWDRGSNITATTDNVWPGRDVAYTIDNLDRVTRALESSGGGGGTTRDELWTLTQTGNWHERKLDLDGDLNYNDPPEEMDDCGTFNKANEWLTRDTDCNASANYTLVHDEVGNLIDDGKDWEFVYDAFGRLRKIKNQSSVLVEEFTYNGLGYRIGWHSDVDADTDVDANDVWFHFAYDDAWRIVGTFRSTDTNAKELFVAHMAGANGRGSSSALDAVVLRDRDANTSWGSATDGTREERLYHCQNWRGDIVNLLKSTGGTNCSVAEIVRYSSYGVPFGMSPGDVDGDGDVDDNDNWPAGYEVRCDYDLDGDMDITDQNLTIANSGRTLGRGVLSHSSVANRKGYCGYEHDGVVDTLAHVRHRVLMTELGRWSRRDPLGYVDGHVVSGAANAPDTGAKGGTGGRKNHGPLWRAISTGTGAAIRSGVGPVGSEESEFLGPGESAAGFWASHQVTGAKVIMDAPLDHRPAEGGLSNQGEAPAPYLPTDEPTRVNRNPLLLPILIGGAAAATLRCAANTYACKVDVNTEREYCLDRCVRHWINDSLPPNTTVLDCCSCCVEKADEDDFNCVISCGGNGPDGDYNRCFGNP